MKEYFNLTKTAQEDGATRSELIEGTGFYDANAIKLIRFFEQKSKGMLELVMKIKRKEVEPRVGLQQWAYELMTINNVSRNAREDIMNKLKYIDV